MANPVNYSRGLHYEWITCSNTFDFQLTYIVKRWRILAAILVDIMNEYEENENNDVLFDFLRTGSATIVL